MQLIFTRIYTVILRVQGSLGLLLGLGAVLLIPGELDKGRFAGVPATFAAIGIILSTTMVFPKLTPGWLAEPSGWRDGAKSILFHSLAPFVFAFTAFKLIIPFDNSDTAFYQNLAFVTGLIGFAASALLLAFACFLSSRRKCDPEVEGLHDVFHACHEAPRGLSTRDIRAIRSLASRPADAA